MWICSFPATATATTFVPRLAIFLLPAILVYPSHALTHQINYNNDQRAEYCYHESYNLGICLGEQQQDQDNQLVVNNAQTLKCLECTGEAEVLSLFFASSRFGSSLFYKVNFKEMKHAKISRH